MAACLKGTRTVQFVKAEDKKTEVLQDNSDLNIHETGYNPNTGDCVFIGYSEKEDYKNRNQETIKGTNLYLWKMNLKKDKKIRKIAHIGLSEGIDYGKWVYIDDRGDIYFQKMGQYVFDGKKVKKTDKFIPIGEELDQLLYMDDNYIYAIKGDSIVKYDVKSKNLKVIFESKMEFSTINNGIALPR